MKKKYLMYSRHQNYIWLSKILKIMRLSVLILIAGIFQVYAGNSYSQTARLSLDMQGTTVQNVLSEIEKNSEFYFLYSNKLVDVDRKVNIKAQDNNIKDILDILFAETSVKYVVFDRQIILSPIEFLRATQQETELQQEVVTGKVTDEDGNSLPGVNIIIKGTLTGTITDMDGNYRIEVHDPNVTLVFSFIGYRTQEVDIAGRAVINITLDQEIIGLEEVVAIGYGRMRKSDLTGSVVSVSADQLNTTMANTIDQALQGRAAGVVVTNNSGQPGASATIRIRGINSLQGTNEPLYIIDGVQLSGANQGTIGFGWAGGGPSAGVQTNPLSSINPSDIASIEILKDASACAIYGSRGANGVIIITTKRGKANELKVSYEYSGGLKSLAKKIDVLNIQDYARYQNELYVNAGKEPRIDLVNPDALTGGTDWQGELFRTAKTTNHQLSVSGGTDKTTYYMGVGYKSDEGTVIGSNFERYSLRLNLENQTRSWLKVGTNINIGRSNNDISMTESHDGAVMLAILYAPDVPVRNADGSYAGPNMLQKEGLNNQAINPVAIATDRELFVKKTEILSNTFADMKWKDLMLHNEIASSISFGNNQGFNPTYKYGDMLENTINQAYYQSNNNLYLEFKTVLNYNHKFGTDHNIIGMVGHEITKNRYEYLDGRRSGFKNNDVHQLNAGDLEGQGTAGNAFNNQTESFFTRLFYNYNDLFMLTGTYRLDGSSKFGEGNRWGGFPSVSSAIRVSNFSFFKNNVSFINNLKIIGSYGETGNAQIGDFLYLARLTTEQTALGLSNAFTIPIADLTWETTKSTNAGIEIGLFDNRISLQAEVYKKKTVDALTRIQLTGFLGSNTLPTMTANGGSIMNKGFDFNLSTVNISGEFTWKTDLTFSHNTNEVLSLGVNGVPMVGGGGIFGAATSLTIEGGPIGRFYGYEMAGLYRNADQIISNPNDIKQPIDMRSGVWLGDIMYEDIDPGDVKDWVLTGYTGQVDENGKYIPGTAVYTGNASDYISMKNVSIIDDNDRTFIGDPNPKFVFGLSNTFSYKNFDFTLFINGVYGNKVMNYTKTYSEGMNKFGFNQTVNVKNRAIPVLNEGGNPDNPFDYILQNADSDVPRAIFGDPAVNVRVSSRYIEDGSYLRIKNVVCGYTFPKSIVQRMNISNLRIYANAQNLYTFTKYSGYDPEIGSQNQDSNRTGVDFGHYPVSMMIMFGVQVDF